MLILSRTDFSLPLATELTNVLSRISKTFSLIIYQKNPQTPKKQQNPPNPNTPQKPPKNYRKPTKGEKKSEKCEGKVFYINKEYFHLHFRHLTKNKVICICSANIFKDFWKYSLLVLKYITKMDIEKIVVKEPFTTYYSYNFKFKRCWEVDCKKKSKMIKWCVLC